MSLTAISAPACNPDCGRNAHCEYGIVNQCVCNTGTTGNPYEGCSKVETKTCRTTQCGDSAECRELYNNVECVCPAGFGGNPYVGCRDLDECSNNACGESAVCINTPGSYDCRCKEGYAGNPFVMCARVQGGGVCQDAYSCSCNANILCPVGFSCENGRCKNLCENVRCGPRAGCDGGKCVCPPGYVGNPRDMKNGCNLKDQCNNDAECKDSEICFQLGKGLRKCVDACSKIQCGPNALCVGANHRSSCICASGYFGNPGDLTMGCQSEERVNMRECERDGDCKKGTVCGMDGNGIQKCINPCTSVACGLHEVCQLGKGNQPNCVCKPEYMWNPVTSLCEKPSVPDCTLDADCRQTAACTSDALGVLKCVSVCSHFTCPTNAVCIASDHKGSCQCLDGFTGNPNDRNGCRPLLQNQCTSDGQCSELEKCAKVNGIFTCRPSCEYISCGPHAVCIVNNHVAQCQCPPGPYAGNPNDLINGCKSVPCVYNVDCPPTQLCNRLSHTCHDVCNEDSCGINSVCLAENHKAICQCPPGFHPNPTAEIECGQLDSCNPNPCHPSAICEGSPSGHTCKCPAKFIGDPFQTGCRPEGDCLHEDDCPIQSVCKSGRCVNPCEHITCGPNSVCNVMNRKPVCACPARFVPSPNGPQDGCTRTTTSCSTDLDCGNDICFNGICKSVCRNNDDCTSDERCIQKMCMIPCAAHTQCPLNQACTGGMCIMGCRGNKDCPTDHACINNKCQNPCLSDNVCGPNALCTCVDHQTICHCPAGFDGNPTPNLGCIRMPTSCTTTSECPTNHMCIGNMCNLPCSDTSFCAVGERCYNNVCVKVCYGDSNCLQGEICVKGVCQPGCATDSDCKQTQVCTNNKCRCAVGFIQGPQECMDIDECETKPCHKSATCTNIPGSYRCTCPDGTVGDPFFHPGCRKPNQCDNDNECSELLACRRGKCVDPCISQRCGPAAECNIFNHAASCDCPSGYLGDGFDTKLGCFKVECLADVDCPDNKFCDTENNKCASPCDKMDCGKGACAAQVHRATCNCFSGYQLIDDHCVDIDECSSLNPCHASAM